MLRPGCCPSRRADELINRHCHKELDVSGDNYEIVL